MKIKTKLTYTHRLIKTYTKLEGNQFAHIMNVLEGNLSSREAGKELGLSHQQVLNLLAKLFREWYQSGALTLNQKKLK